MINVDLSLCTGCGECVSACPFGALEIENGRPVIGGGCRMCNLCVKKCPAQALSAENKEDKPTASKDYSGAMVYIEHSNGAVHPVSLEMAGKARELLKDCGGKLYGFTGGSEISAAGLLDYGFDEIYVYPELGDFITTRYTDALCDCIAAARPSIVLVGGTPFGRCLAPAAATRLKTGITADCTTLIAREDGALVQIRPAFGGNIMAQIVTPNTRPQFATVRYKVMKPAERGVPRGKIVTRKMPEPFFADKSHIDAVLPVEKSESICDAHVIVAGGRGLKDKKDIGLLKELASLLHGEYAVTRPLIEMGWAPYTRQIGLSGRSVAPELIITFGISGAIQFVTAIEGAQKIIAVNSDASAEIFKSANIGIVGDLYEILPEMIEQLKAGVKHA